MEQGRFEFIRKTKSYPNFNFDKPTVIYDLLSTDKQTLKVEFIFSINSKIIIGEKTFYCGPPNDKMSFGSINILNEERAQIGMIDFFGLTFTKKKVILYSETENSIHEEWIITRNHNIFKNEFWRKSNFDFTLVNGFVTIGYKKERKKFNWKELFQDNKSEKVVIQFSENFKNELLLCGLIIYVSELIEFEMKNN